MKKRIGIVCILVCISLACEKNIEVELPPIDEKICAKGLFLTTEPILLEISHSKHIFDTTRTFHLENVAVDFYENDVFLETLENKGFIFEGARLEFVSSSGFIPRENNSYSIVITSADFKTAYATNIVPQPVPILKIDTFSVTGEIPDWYKAFSYYGTTKPMLECRILFKDPPDISNLYSLHVRRKDDQYIPYFCNDPVLEFWEQQNVMAGGESIYDCHIEYFSDRHIDGESYELIVLLDKIWVRYKIYFELLSLSEEYYFFKKSVSPSYSMQYDPFREPVQVYSNIQNGVGIFAGASVSVDSLIIK